MPIVADEEDALEVEVEVARAAPVADGLTLGRGRPDRDRRRRSLTPRSTASPPGDEDAGVSLLPIGVGGQVSARSKGRV
jgi:hypothetical protein